MAEDDRRLISCAVSVAPVVKWQLYGKVISRVFLGLRPVHLKILTFENVGTLSFSIFSEFGYVTDFFYVPAFFEKSRHFLCVFKISRSKKHKYF